MKNDTSRYRTSLWCLLGIILLLITMLFFSHEWGDSRRNLHIECHGSMYLLHDPGVRDLSVQINSFHDQAELIYQVRRDGKVVGGLRLTGKLIDWKPADLTYRFSMTKGQVLMNFAQAPLPAHVERITKRVQHALDTNESIFIEIVQLERQGNRVLLGFSKSDSLLSCEM